WRVPFLLRAPLVPCTTPFRSRRFRGRSRGEACRGCPRHRGEGAAPGRDDDVRGSAAPCGAGADPLRGDRRAPPRRAHQPSRPRRQGMAGGAPPDLQGRPVGREPRPPPPRRGHHHGARRRQRRDRGLSRQLLVLRRRAGTTDRKSTRLNSSHVKISYAVFCLKKKKKKKFASTKNLT